MRYLKLISKATLPDKIPTEFQEIVHQAKDALKGENPNLDYLRGRIRVDSVELLTEFAFSNNFSDQFSKNQRIALLHLSRGSELNRWRYISTDTLENGLNFLASEQDENDLASEISATITERGRQKIEKRRDESGRLHRLTEPSNQRDTKEEVLNIIKLVSLSPEDFTTKSISIGLRELSYQTSELAGVRLRLANGIVSRFSEMDNQRFVIETKGCLSAGIPSPLFHQQVENECSNRLGSLNFKERTELMHSLTNWSNPSRELIDRLLPTEWPTSPSPNEFGSIVRTMKAYVFMDDISMARSIWDKVEPSLPHDAIKALRYDLYPLVITGSLNITNSNLLESYGNAT